MAQFGRAWERLRVPVPAWELPMVAPASRRVCWFAPAWTAALFPVPLFWLTLQRPQQRQEALLVQLQRVTVRALWLVHWQHWEQVPLRNLAALEAGLGAQAQARAVAAAVPLAAARRQVLARPRAHLLVNQWSALSWPVRSGCHA